MANGCVCPNTETPMDQINKAIAPARPVLLIVAFALLCIAGAKYFGVSIPQVRGDFGRLPIAKVHGFPLCQYEFNVELEGEARTFNHDCFAIEQVHELDTMLDKAIAANLGRQ